jgi:hypothetical protein
MKGLNKFKTKVLLFLVSGILFLSFGFILISCGTGPMLKVFETMKGAYAIDFSLASGSNSAYITASGDNFPSISGQPFTVEAWVKPKSSNVRSPIFSHVDGTRGILVYLYDNVLHALIGYGSTSTTRSTAETTSGDALTPNEWSHIAVVLVNQSHNHSPTTCGGTQGSENHHVDIYINGDFKSCQWTNSNYALDPTGDDRTRVILGYEAILLTMTVYEGGSPITFSRLNAVIDDVRFWLAARTDAEIDQCNDGLLGLTYPCNIDYKVNNEQVLKGYWPFNEGIGAIITDISGNNIGGSIYSPADVLWDGGWATGVY